MILHHLLFLGEDYSQAQERIRLLKEKIFSNPNGEKFDYEILEGTCSAYDLKKALVSLPAVSRHRLLVIQDISRLKKDCRSMLIDFFKRPCSPTIIVCKDGGLKPSDALVQALKPFVDIEMFNPGRDYNVFDLTRLIERRQTAKVLAMLDELLKNGEPPLKMMGGLLWFWKKNKNCFSQKVYIGGLEALREADIRIKRSQMKADQVMEILVVKLCERNALVGS